MTLHPSPKESLPEIWYLYSEEDQPVLVFGEGHIETIIFQRAVYFTFGREIDHEDIIRGYIEESCIEKNIDSEKLFLTHFSGKEVRKETEKGNGDDIVKITVGKLQRPTFITMKRQGPT